MKRIIFGSISVLLVFAATAPAFAYGKVEPSNNSLLTGQSNLLAEVPLPTLHSQPSPTSGLQTPKTLQLTQQNSPAEVSSPTLQLYERQQALVAQMETMMAQMKVMMAQMKTMSSNKPQTSRNSQLTQQNPSSEVASPTLLLYEQQQALIAQMEAMMAQMKVMMEQMKVINVTPTRHGLRSSVFQQQAMMAEMKTMIPQMKIMVQAMNATPSSSNMPSLEKVSDLNSQN